MNRGLINDYWNSLLKLKSSTDMESDNDVNSRVYRCDEIEIGIGYWTGDVDCREDVHVDVPAESVGGRSMAGMGRLHAIVRRQYQSERHQRIRNGRLPHGTLFGPRHRRVSFYSILQHSKSILTLHIDIIYIYY